MKALQIEDIKKMVSTIGYPKFYEKLIKTLEEDYSNWETFDKTPRLANHVPDGVIELMPISNDKLYSFKYVNGHPKNPLQNHMTVMGTGQLSEVSTGAPLMYTEMTLLTALRTAANSVMAARYMAKKESKVLTLIGTGAQSEFQFLAFKEYFPLEEVRYFDTDPKAMDKFERNMKSFDMKLTRCENAKEAVQGADIITVCTADKRYQTILTKDMITSDVYINAIGGDCPGKTEIGKDLVESSFIVCEFLEQCKIEGEIQQLADDFTCTELYEVVRGEKKVNVETHGTILFDSVGFAIEDYSALRLTYDLAKELNIGTEMNFIPELDDVKNLFQLMS
ncbi:ornithine cyclodeaminase [Psychroflexus halocasei]|uniref:Ornithine cyclodeaminase n=1 Tax=Psychroflexus halocasei TaxID=908615 RepID=A0A1H3ZUW3_9FLAO|nr:ornithine cyclodeaminase [Psychroflexus halocasei]SEA27450.1 ornithine cyclodeaminase [Psychroflexus halocasei]